MTPCSEGVTNTRTGVPAGVCLMAFTSRFSTIRSTFGGSIGTMTDSAETSTCRTRRIGLRDHPPNEVSHVGRLERRRQHAAREPVEIEEVRDQPLEPSSVVLDAAGELPRLLGSQPDVAALERDGHAEDRCQRRSEVVGHGLEEGVLHLVERSKPGGRLALDLERPLQVLLRALAVTDVPDERREDGLLADRDGHDRELHREQPPVPAEGLDLDPRVEDRALAGLVPALEPFAVCHAVRVRDDRLHEGAPERPPLRSTRRSSPPAGSTR